MNAIANANAAIAAAKQRIEKMRTAPDFRAFAELHKQDVQLPLVAVNAAMNTGLVSLDEGLDMIEGLSLRSVALFVNPEYSEIL